MGDLDMVALGDLEFDMALGDLDIPDDLDIFVAAVASTTMASMEVHLLGRKSAESEPDLY